ncbi:hypothetical protein ACIQ6R_18050 [Streptomyces sp. NPDC096048]|uniref:hypothetical protein n=1 Tax=Streptomyces sp. NPDC096048 TaxID=3366072 RepID=UPI003826F466
MTTRRPATTAGRPPAQEQPPVQTPARIEIREVGFLNAFETKILGSRWTWRASCPSGSRSGFARTEARARRRAERAARSLATRPTLRSTVYTISEETS